MSEDTENVVAQCITYLKFRRNNQEEPLMPHPVPEHPWQAVGTDMMTSKAPDYLVVVDYFIKYPEIALLESKTAATAYESQLCQTWNTRDPCLRQHAVCQQGVPAVCRQLGNIGEEFKSKVSAVQRTK